MSTSTKERQPHPEKSLYRVWIILKNGETKTHYSFINRLNPKKAKEYIKTIHERMEVGYAWLIDNQSDELLEVFDTDHWRQPDDYEYYLFKKNKNK
ncbi:hypothetical protein VB776_07010 [Arcicella sp. DC2W]|uniref:Uncharacterized protein n=1 Tax=Arcicella gelida TaxID=2984195 RepID=A0ABU5S2D3_9BACT|nr:hypothetical protein [Arcicella sp. DC2W]MEA5402657.1 hypothetical protein [Arcicella sp. DC2W]